MKNEIIKIDNTEYIQGRHLGKGGFGNCFEFQDIKTKKLYAGKIIDIKLLKDNDFKDNKKRIDDEIKYLKEFDSPRIVKYYGCKKTADKIYIILELCSNGSLKELIKKRKKLTEIEVQNFIFQLIQGLKLLHNKKYIHCDLKPSNLLLDEKLILKIADFGSVIEKGDNIEKNAITHDYYPPKVICSGKDSGQSLSFDIDIWSIGIIIYELLVGSTPWEQGKDKTRELIEEKVGISAISESAKDLIKQILVLDPKKRPSLNQILYHDFFHRNIFPEYLNITCLERPPTEEELGKIDPNYNENNFKKEDNDINLYEIPAPDQEQIKYEEIKSYVLKNWEEIDNYITYIHYSSSMNFYYFELSDNLNGIYFSDEKILIKNINIDKIYYIQLNKEERDIIEIYDFDKVPKILKEKYNKFKDYCESAEKKRANNKSSSIIFQKDIKQENENDDKKKQENKNDDGNNSIIEQIDIDYSNIFYIRSILKDEKAFYLVLSNGLKEAIFKDYSKIIVSEKDDKVMYITKSQKIHTLNIDNIMKNSCVDLIKRLKYFRQLSAEYIKRKLLAKPMFN